MKRKVLIFLSLGIMAGTALMAQDTTNSVVEKIRLSKYLTMQNGKMVSVENGKIQPMTGDIILPNGTTIMAATGTVKSSDGSTTQLKEGERLDIEGKLIPVNKTIPADTTTQKPQH